MAYTVFLSSTLADFHAERESLIQHLPLIGVTVECVELASDLGLSPNETLRSWIDRSNMVVLLLGTRAGTKIDGDRRWTKAEIDYAFATKKRVLPYIREIDSGLTLLVDRDSEAASDLRAFIHDIRGKVVVVPRYKHGECCKLTAMVVRDVERYSRELDRLSYEQSFTR